MQQKEQKKSPIKHRILQFVDSLGISKREFYSKTGISRGTLDNNAGITEDTLTKLFATYKNINPLWLINGDGFMLINQSSKSVKTTNEVEELRKECNDKANKIILLLEENLRLKERLQKYEGAD